MKRSTNRILTTHVGSLPRPDDLMALYRDDAPDGTLQPRLRAADRRRGAPPGRDRHRRRQRRRVRQGDARARWISARGGPTSIRACKASSCATSRPRRAAAPGPTAARSARTSPSSTPPKRAPPRARRGRAAPAPRRFTASPAPSPVKYTGHAAIKRDIDNLAAAARTAGVEEAFMTAVSPATLQILPNAYYKSAEDYTWALAEAIREEYKAIVDAGFILQIDDPALVDIYDWWFSLNDDIAGYRKWAAFQVEARQPRARWHPRGSRPLPHLLGQLARSAQGRRRTEGRRRPPDQGEGAGLLGRGRQRAPRARVEGLAGHQAAGRQGADPRRRQPRHQRAGASGARRRPHRPLREGRRPRERHRRDRLRPRRPRCIRSSPGPSSARSPRARGWRARSFGAKRPRAHFN